MTVLIIATAQLNKNIKYDVCIHNNLLKIKTRVEDFESQIINLKQRYY